MQVFSLELEEDNDITVYKRHGLHTKAQSPKIKVPHRNEPSCTLVPASTLYDISDCILTQEKNE